MSHFSSEAPRRAPWPDPPDNTLLPHLTVVIHGALDQTLRNQLTFCGLRFGYVDDKGGFQVWHRN